MRAAWYERAGPAAEVLQFGEMDDPVPGPGEIRVRVSLSAVNPTDVKRRARGREVGQFDRIIPHNDGAGIVDEIGEDVAKSRIGERVWIFGAQAGRPFGTAAEFVVLPSRQAIALPDGISLEEGACLGVPAVTAHRCLFADGPVDGLTVLVTGAAGRVGRCAVQIAKWAGATVVATVGSDEKADHVAALGADHVVNYRTENVAEAVKRASGGVDRIVEVAFGANIGMAPKLLRTNGVIATYASDAVPKPEIPFYPLMYNNNTIRPVAIFAMPEAAQDAAFRDITACLAAGALSAKIDRQYGFEGIVAAQEAIEGEAVFGCVLVEVAPTS